MMKKQRNDTDVSAQTSLEKHDGKVQKCFCSCLSVGIIETILLINA